VRSRAFVLLALMTASAAVAQEDEAWLDELREIADGRVVIEELTQKTTVLAVMKGTAEPGGSIQFLVVLRERGHAITKGALDARSR
jgi:hypothetical protein